MIDVHVPSIRPDRLRRLAKSMEVSGLFGAGAQLSVTFSPPHYSDDEIEALTLDFPRLRMAAQTTQHPVAPSMIAHRADVHRCFTVTQPWLLFDDDDEFTRPCLPYLKQCVQLIERMEAEVGVPFFIGTAGTFGSNHRGDTPHFSPTNALMPKGHGLLFPVTMSLDGSEFDHVAGGLEEHLICAYFTSLYNAIPLKRFRNPAQINFRREAGRGSSLIHDWDIWDKNSMVAIRNLSGDHGWLYPKGMGSKGTKAPKPYVERVRQAERAHGPLLTAVWEQINAG